SLAPCLISVLGVHDPLLVTLPGTAYKSLFCSAAHRAVTRVPEFSPASTTSTPTLSPLSIRFRRGKFCGAGNVPSGNSLTIAPPVSRISSASFLFSFGYTNVHPGPPHRHGCRPRQQRPPVRAAIDPPRHPAHNQQVPSRQIPRQHLCDSRPIGRR